MTAETFFAVFCGSIIGNVIGFFITSTLWK